MLKKSFFGLSKSRIDYEILPIKMPEPDKVFTSDAVTLLHPRSSEKNIPALFRSGDKVKTGQKIALYADDPAYVISPVTGTIASISPFTGNYGKSYSAISISMNAEDEFDDQFRGQIENPTLEVGLNFLSCLPGKPPFHLFTDPEKPIDTIVITGVDQDLLIGTNQHLARTNLAAIKQGIKILKQLTAIDNIIMVMPGESMQGYGHIGAEVKALKPEYPAALPAMIMQNILGREMPADKTCEDLGVCFFSAESVVAISEAFETGNLPSTKMLTLIAKEGSRRLIQTAVGTPIGEVLKAFNITVNEKDRVVLGGPMTGSAIYSMDYPVQPDTDAIMVLDRTRAAYVSDYPCINCGDCVRVCPARIQVQMLVRILEAGHYDEAADNYDLHSCIECGLCSYVCVSKIPIFQYIRLGKYELDRATTSEATDV